MVKKQTEKNPCFKSQERDENSLKQTKNVMWACGNIRGDLCGEIELKILCQKLAKGSDLPGDLRSVSKLPKLSWKL